MTALTTVTSFQKRQHSERAADSASRGGGSEGVTGGRKNKSTRLPFSLFIIPLNLLRAEWSRRRLNRRTKAARAGAALCRADRGAQRGGGGEGDGAKGRRLKRPDPGGGGKKTEFPAANLSTPGTLSSRMLSVESPLSSCRLELP